MPANQPEPLSVYMAGPLFHHADLVGSALLAEALSDRSQGRYVAILPQDIGPTHGSAEDVRNHNFRQLMAADLALLNFSGAELDPGTVVEFIYAKVLDIPAVILRTDSRVAGEQLPDGDPWNLMCSFYPRTDIVTMNAPAVYGAVRLRGGSSTEAARILVDEVADRVIAGLDRAWNQKPVLPQDADRQRVIYQWAATFPGGVADAVHVQGVRLRKRTRSRPAGEAPGETQ